MSDQYFTIYIIGLVENYPCIYGNARDDYQKDHIQKKWAKTAQGIVAGSKPII